MKSSLKGLVLVALMFAFFNGESQTVEIIPSYGYQFGTKLKYGGNYLKAKDSDQYGISVGYGLYDNLIAGISYTRMSTELRIRDRIVSPSEDRLSDLNFDWFLLGATRYFQPGKVRPFAGGGVGLVVISPKNVNTTIANRGLPSTTRLAFNFKAGVNIMFSDRVGLNLQGNLFLPVQWGGVYIAGGPGGISSGVSAGTTTVMGGVSGGLVFKLGE
ncbi:MAG: outer membrane beta-barrel protein [Maribacter sp.]|nr:outer membrane beta-barrel protein [Maribacter sp.]